MGRARTGLPAGHDGEKSRAPRRPHPSPGKGGGGGPRRLCGGDGQVYFGPGGVREGARPGQIWVDLSTIAPAHAEAFYGRAKELGVFFLDAPVSGGPMGAEAGTLTIMVGGDADAFERVRAPLRLRPPDVGAAGAF
ncbi:MAG: hypothetical protein KM312_04775 [Hydrogenibacillus schlegelii]|uniref:6-phosphogluconate dehydrogenase NADP-binding domain-containing protein n=1 Tax=Hydrogenibacillus schlegelii TaxID=1484 RepID=A0A947D0Q7_HYDSH|nr:hypothetical protein [Hydrogenibacillus schlegelii]